MRCPYLDKDDYCHSTTIWTMTKEDNYKTEPENQGIFCKNNAGMLKCPRMIAYQSHLKAQHGQ